MIISSVCNQMEPSEKDMSVQTHSCAVFEFVSSTEGVAEEACLWSEQVNDCLSPVAKHREEVERLRSFALKGCISPFHRRKAANRYKCCQYKSATAAASSQSQLEIWHGLPGSCTSQVFPDG